MGDRYLTDLAAVLRAAGLEVVELDGWRERARGSGGYDAGRPTHVMVHHTASPPSSSGSPDAWYCATGDEDAPLANLCLDRAGVWWVLAAGATNTNGAGGPLDGVPADSMNTHAIGVEANGGAGSPWPLVQTDAYVLGVRALCDAYGIELVRAHFEWAPDRKIDPAGPSPWAAGDQSWNMAAFRADVAGSTSPPAPAPARRRRAAATHREGDHMFIAVKDGAYWIGNGLGRRHVDDSDELATLLENFNQAGTPLIDWQSGRPVTKSSEVSGAKQLDKLGVNIEG